MIALVFFVLALLASPFKSKRRLEAENAALRQQLTVLRRQVCGRVRLTNNDRLFFVQLYRWFPSVLNVITVIRPETLVRWHRVGFRCYWRWKMNSGGGGAQIQIELRVLIRQLPQRRFAGSILTIVETAQRRRYMRAWRMLRLSW